MSQCKNINGFTIQKVYNDKTGEFEIHVTNKKVQLMDALYEKIWEWLQ